MYCIMKNYCRHGVLHRTQKKLKDLWKNLKRTSKTKQATNKKAVFATGNNVEVPPLSPVTSRTLGVIQDQILPLENPYDDDAGINKDQVCCFCRNGDN